jgi:hypothetical protein
LGWAHAKPNHCEAQQCECRRGFSDEAGNSTCKCPAADGFRITKRAPVNSWMDRIVPGLGHRRNGGIVTALKVIGNRGRCAWRVQEFRLKPNLPD